MLRAGPGALSFGRVSSGPADSWPCAAGMRAPSPTIPIGGTVLRPAQTRAGACAPGFASRYEGRAPRAGACKAQRGAPGTAVATRPVPAGAGHRRSAVARRPAGPGRFRFRHMHGVQAAVAPGPSALQRHHPCLWQSRARRSSCPGRRSGRPSSAGCAPRFGGPVPRQRQSGRARP